MDVWKEPAEKSCQLVIGVKTGPYEREWTFKIKHITPVINKLRNDIIEVRIVAVDLASVAVDIITERPNIIVEVSVDQVEEQQLIFVEIVQVTAADSDLENKTDTDWDLRATTTRTERKAGEIGENNWNRE